MIRIWLQENVRNVNTHSKPMRHGLGKVLGSFVGGSVLLYGGLSIYGVKITHNINHLFHRLVQFALKHSTHIIKGVNFVHRVVGEKPIVGKIIIGILEKRVITVFIGGYCIIMVKLQSVKTIIARRKVQFLNGLYCMARNMKEIRKTFGNYVKAVICIMTANHLLYLEQE